MPLFVLLKINHASQHSSCHRQIAYPAKYHSAHEGYEAADNVNHSASPSILAPQFGHDLAFEAISAPQVLHLIIFILTFLSLIQSISYLSLTLYILLILVSITISDISHIFPFLVIYHRRINLYFFTCEV